MMAACVFLSLPLSMMCVAASIGMDFTPGHSPGVGVVFIPLFAVWSACMLIACAVTLFWLARELFWRAQQRRAGSGEAENPSWTWWEARRLRYNRALAISGWVAYALNAAILYSFTRPTWTSPQLAAITIFLGTAFLGLMGVANLCYLLGAWAESIFAPKDVGAFRTRAYAVGFWSSMAVPFAFPLTNLSLLLTSN
jgi:hypothetical protein